MEFLKSAKIKFKEYRGGEPAWSLFFKQSGELSAKPRRAAGARRGWFFKLDFCGVFLGIMLIFLFPFFAGAQVVVNEVAWMGTENSANDEWIELKNTSSSTVDVSGWVLEAEDGSPKINLSGSIGAGEYFLLERSDDTSVPTIPADLIYSGALSNSGEVLVLKDASGAEVDRVDGSDSWENIGGDKTTKQTAQKTETGWITATSTPKAENLKNKNSTVVKNTEDKSDKVDAIQNSDENKKSNIKADAGESIIAKVGQDIFFDGSMSFGDITSFSWNMGNGAIVEKKSFLYSYDFPGKYLVTLFVSDGFVVVEDKIEVLIYPDNIYISEFFYGEGKKSGWVEIYNDSDNYVDLSLYKIISDKNIFEIPKGTFLGAKSYLVFSENILGGEFIKKEGSISIAYPNGQVFDGVNYSFDRLNLSASRKNKDEFILTKNKTPGYANVAIFYKNQSDVLDDKESILNINKSNVDRTNLVDKNIAHFVKIGSKKSFLATPAYAKLINEENNSQNEEGIDDKDALNLKANLSEFSFNATLFIVIIFAFVLFFILKKKS